MLHAVSGAFKKKAVWAEIIVYFFIFLFLYTGINKLLDFSVFRIQLSDSAFMPDGRTISGILSWVIAILVPFTEIVVSCLLFMPGTRRFGLLMSTILMTLFSLYVGAIIVFVPGNKQPCSCGGVYDNMNWNWHLGLNLAFTFLAFVAWRMYKPVK